MGAKKWVLWQPLSRHRRNFFLNFFRKIEIERRRFLINFNVSDYELWEQIKNQMVAIRKVLDAFRMCFVLLWPLPPSSWFSIRQVFASDISRPYTCIYRALFIYVCYIIGSCLMRFWRQSWILSHRSQSRFLNFQKYQNFMTKYLNSVPISYKHKTLRYFPKLNHGIGESLILMLYRD